MGAPRPKGEGQDGPSQFRKLVKYPGLPGRGRAR